MVQFHTRKAHIKAHIQCDEYLPAQRKQRAITPARRLTTVAIAVLALGGCATWSTSDVQTPSVAPSMASTPASAPTKRMPTTPDKVELFEGDVSERSYDSLGDISVTVNKTTLFHPDPTREMVAQRLKEEAAKLGADAVIHVRYGTVGISPMSWGSLDGKGRAIIYVPEQK